MTPDEAKVLYEAAWPALNAEKEAATARGDVKAARKARQKLSALNGRYYVRLEKSNVDLLCPFCGQLMVAP